MFVFRAGQLDMSTALDLTNYLDKEREYVPWSSAFSHLGFIGSMLSMRPSYGFYQVSMGLNMLQEGGISKHNGKVEDEPRSDLMNCDRPISQNLKCKVYILDISNDSFNVSLVLHSPVLN